MKRFYDGREVTEKRVEKFMSRLDMDDDGLIDWEEYGGAPILGLDSVFIKAHGRSSGRALANACRVAAKAARAQLPEQIREGLQQLPEEA